MINFPNENYDLIIIGAGSAGLVAAVSAGAIGANVALIEKSKIGGECSWTGCVPSKSLAHYAQNLKIFNKYFKNLEKEKRNYAENVFKHVNMITEKASKSSKVKKLLKRYDVDVIFGSPSFIDNNTISLNGKKYSAKKFIISTGSSPKIPKIKGLDSFYLTNRNIWNLKELPKSMVILGAGPIGIEMAQSFNRLGTEINVIEVQEKILPKDDEELSSSLYEILKREGIKFHLNSKIKQLEVKENNCTVKLDDKEINAEKLLVATGRKSNVEGLDLEKVEVKYSEEAILTDKGLKTTANNIWAAGDCNGIYQFSHISEIEAKIAVRNALFPFNNKIDYQGVPWATFTNPVLAHLGLTEQECRKRNMKYNVYIQNFSGDDRAIIEGKTNGFVKIISNKFGKIIGAHILGPRAAELLNELVLARRKSLRIPDIGLTSHVYPSLGIAVQRATDEWFTDIANIGIIRMIINFFRY